MRRTVIPTLLRLGTLVAALLVAVLVSVITATAIHSEPEGHLSIREAAFVEPVAVERPVAVAGGVQNAAPPSITPEPAVPPELRNIKPEPPEAAPPSALELEQAAQREAERQEAKRQRAEQRRLERRKAEQQRIEQQRIEQQRIEQQRIERQRIERQRAERQKTIERRKARAEREKAEAASAAWRVRALPAAASERASAGQTRPAPAKSKPGVRRPAARGSGMALSIKAIGLRNSQIETTDSQRALDNGLIHLPTSRPWQRDKPRNVYVVGHRMGWPGTESWKIFYRLPELQRGDRLALTSGGKTYRYRVSEKLVVNPWDVWVTDPVKGRDLLSLQTCIGPNFGKRLIVRADRV